MEHIFSIILITMRICKAGESICWSMLKRAASSDVPVRRKVIAAARTMASDSIKITIKVNAAASV
ncbi:MAG: hypothetical protein ABJK43_17825 [Lentilitoribacter sp.]